MDKIARLQEFLRSQPGDSFLQHALALEYVKANQSDEAERFFKNILSADPNYIGSYYHLGKLLEGQGRHAEAIEWYQKGMAAATQAGDRHAFSELQGAMEDLDPES